MSSAAITALTDELKLVKNLIVMGVQDLEATEEKLKMQLRDAVLSRNVSICYCCSALV
jgi:hypothetical protein